MFFTYVVIFGLIFALAAPWPINAICLGMAIGALPFAIHMRSIEKAAERKAKQDRERWIRKLERKIRKDWEDHNTPQNME